MGLLGLENSEQELLMSPVSGQKLQHPNSKRKNNEVEVLPLIPPVPSLLNFKYSNLSS